MKRAVPPKAGAPYEERTEFRRVTIAMPPDIYARLVRESARRKIAGEPNQLLSTMLREAVYAYLERLPTDYPQDEGAAPNDSWDIEL